MYRLLAVVACLLVGVGDVAASETRWWEVDTAEDMLKGRGEGVAVTQDGRLLPVAKWSNRIELEEPVAMAAVAVGDGKLLVGTGFPARLYRIGEQRAELVAEFQEEQVTAVYQVGPDEIYVATVAPGSLYRVKDKSVELVGQVEIGGMWDLVEFDGQLIVAAGPPASLYRLTENGLRRWLEIPDSHIRCLEVADDTLLVGTSGKGLVFGVRPDGALSLVADSPFTEISDLLAAPDSTVWATALVGEPVRQSAPQQSSTNGKAVQATVETGTGPQDLDLPKINGSTASSELLRLTPEGAIIRVHRFASQIASALAWDGTGVLVGTGFEGEVWRFIGDGGARLATVDAVQATAFSKTGNAVLVQGPAGVIWRESAPSPDASFRGPPLNLKRPAFFGRYQVRGDAKNAKIRFRSGATGKPDESWLPWSAWQPGVGTVPLPPSTSLQWEVSIGSSAEGEDVVERVEVAYREVNVSPRITNVVLEEPGVIYLGGPPPAGAVIEATNPDVSGIFSVLEPNGNGGPTNPRQGKKYWRVGYRTISWKAEDENEDPLRFEVQVEGENGFTLPVKQHLRTTQLGVDVSAIPDGTYRFRIMASDGLRNPGAPRTGQAVSRWFVVDNTPPRVEVARQKSTWLVTVSDTASAIGSVQMSRDGQEWQTLEPRDGILDGHDESFSFPAQSGRHLIVVRVVDAHHNRTVVGAEED
jgi:hypothetical protein